MRFELRVPLARGAGDAAVTPLRVAEAEARAAGATLEHSAARTVLAAAQAYWNYAGQLQREAITLAGERRGAALLEELRKLVDADEIPRADLQLAQASLSERRSARFAAQQGVLEARRTLGRVLGLDTPALLALGPPADGFPQPPAREGDAPSLQDAAEATARRADVQALRDRRAAAQLRIQAAQDVGRPRLDLVLGATRNSLGEGARATDLGATFHRGAPPGGTVGVLYQRPLGADNTAQGLLRQQLALAEGLDAELRELADSIESAVVAAEFGVRRAAGQLREAEAAVRTYAAGVENERTKRRLGMATLIDVLAVEDRYNNALLAAVQARADFALAIARLRFESGTLVVAQPGGHEARVDALLHPETG
ncbi:TolC family protein [Ramlibacter terrae]|uniref:TolC family protein n=1 Tax=Ramlibacter terrae TaxID=2732511 RepID=A0ABX6P3V8_9BURK|nr:TolC family protein [Ramlibacter terrae]